MKVLYLLDSLNLGGTEILALDLCRNARANGLDITLAAMGGGILEEAFLVSGVDFVRLRRLLPIDPFVVLKLRKIIKNENVRIIHAHQAVEGLHAHLAAAGTGCKIVLSHHGFVRGRKNLRTLKYLIPRVAKNVYVSEGLQRWYLRENGIDSGVNSAVIYNGVDKKRLRYSGEGLKTELGLAENCFLVGMIANFYAAPRKDHKTLCEAFVEIAQAREEAHLILAGKIESGAEEKLAECVEVCKKAGLLERVHFLGSRTDLPKILSSLDLFVLSSVHEGLGIAAIEAMLAGKPCVLSDIEPLLEVSGNGEFAAMFQTRNPSDLSQKIMRLIVNPEVAKRISERAFENADSNFSIEAHIRTLKEFYERTVDS